MNGLARHGGSLGGESRREGLLEVSSGELEGDLRGGGWFHGEKIGTDRLIEKPGKVSKG